MGWLTEAERRTVTAALARLIPPGSDPATEPGAAEAGVVDYIDNTLDAFAHDPPLIYAGGPKISSTFTPLSRVEEIAWRGRIGGWQAAYRAGLDTLGPDFADLSGEEQDARLDADPGFKDLIYEHAVEGFYAAPQYGGNRDLAGWRLAEYPGDVAPHGWTAEQISNPEQNP